MCLLLGGGGGGDDGGVRVHAVATAFVCGAASFHCVACPKKIQLVGPGAQSLNYLCLTRILFLGVHAGGQLSCSQDKEDNRTAPLCPAIRLFQPHLPLLWGCFGSQGCYS